MTTYVRRRSFLKGVGGGVIGGLGLLYPGFSDVARAGTTVEAHEPPTAGPQSDGSTVLTAAGADPRYAGGEVTAIDGDRFVLTSAAGVRQVAVPATAEVWKEVTGTSSLIELGDWVDVQGEPNEDGSLVATSGMLFVNIARIDGELTAISADSLSLKAYGDQVTVEFSPLLEAIHKEDLSDVVGGVHTFPIGSLIGAVGLRLPNGGIRATRVWI